MTTSFVEGKPRNELALRPSQALTPPASATPTLAGWGQLHAPGRELLGPDLTRITADVPLSRGLGRSYGDSSLPPASRPLVANTTLADRILSFDPATGRLRAEAGLSLFAINELFLPRNWFLPTTPGTQFITLGGAVASDVHGKNHHVAGCFGEHVTALKLRVADGRILEIGPEHEPELFAATIGGMGLTGHILEVEFEMKPIPSPWIYEESERIPDIDRYVQRLKENAARFPFTVGWIDCITTGKRMGRGILMCGRWAEPDEVPRGKRFKLQGRMTGVPVTMPNLLINPLTVKLFNFANYWKHPWWTVKHLIHPQKFFYPLDIVEHWYRLYGKRGFTQYQCVLPTDGPRGVSVARAFLEVLTKLGGATPLCVIKDCGAEGRGMLSFPRPGISLAVDLAVTSRTQRIVDELNEFVIREHGRIYLTKDAFTRAEHFAAMEPRLDRFLELRRKWDPEFKLKSAQSIRVLGDPP